VECEARAFIDTYSSGTGPELDGSMPVIAAPTDRAATRHAGARKMITEGADRKPSKWQMIDRTGRRPGEWREQHRSPRARTIDPAGR